MCADVDADVLIAGSGIAGMTAALFTARLGMRTSVLTGESHMGHLLSIGAIEDFPGFPQGVAGFDLCPMLEEQAVKAGAEFLGTPLLGVERSGGEFGISTGEGELRSKTVILATGSAFRELGVPGEEEFRGRGVSDCASCDGPLYRGRKVAVVGGGDSALQEALELAEHVERVVLFHRGTSLDGQRSYAERVEANPKIEIRYGTVVESIRGDGAVSALSTRTISSDEVREEAVSAVFIYIGLRPRTEAVAGLLQLEADGRIPTDASLRTEVPGVFAAGGIRSGSSQQGVAAAGDGATAAIFAHEYLRDRVA